MDTEEYIVDSINSTLQKLNEELSLLNQRTVEILKRFESENDNFIRKNYKNIRNLKDVRDFLRLSCIDSAEYQDIYKFLMNKKSDSEISDHISSKLKVELIRLRLEYTKISISFANRYFLSKKIFRYYINRIKKNYPIPGKYHPYDNILSIFHEKTSHVSTDISFKYTKCLKCPRKIFIIPDNTFCHSCQIGYDHQNIEKFFVKCSYCLKEILTSDDKVETCPDCHMRFDYRNFKMKINSGKEIDKRAISLELNQGTPEDLSKMKYFEYLLFSNNFSRDILMLTDEEYNNSLYQCHQLVHYVRNDARQLIKTMTNIDLIDKMTEFMLFVCSFAYESIGEFCIRCDEIINPLVIDQASAKICSFIDEKTIIDLIDNFDHSSREENIRMLFLKRKVHQYRLEIFMIRIRMVTDIIKNEFLEFIKLKGLKNVRSKINETMKTLESRHVVYVKEYAMHFAEKHFDLLEYDKSDLEILKELRIH